MSPELFGLLASKAATSLPRRRAMLMERGMSTAGFRRGSSHLFRMIGAGDFLRYGLAMIVQAVTAGMKLFALALKDTKVIQVLIDGIRGAVKRLAGACGRKNECPKHIHYGLLRRNRSLSPIVLVPGGGGRESFATKFYACITGRTHFLIKSCESLLSMRVSVAHRRRWSLCAFAVAMALFFCPSVSKAQYSTPNLANTAYTTSPFAISSLDLVGQCTWYVYGRIQETGVASQQILNFVNPNTGKKIFMGNASTWVADAEAAMAAGLMSTGTQPQPGALAVWTSQNHVAFVENSSGQVTESNNTPTPGFDVVVGGAYARLRSSTDSSSSANILWTMPQFTVMNVLSGPVSANGYQWFQLTGNGYTGWVAWLKADLSGPAVQSGADNLWWNITRIKRQPASPFISGASPTYIYLGAAS